MNRNPIQARLTQRRRRKPGDLTKLTRALWETVRDCEWALEEARGDVDLTCRAAHAMAACCNAYAKLLEAGEVEGRLRRLEQYMEVSQHGQVLPRDAIAAGGAGAD